MTTAPIGRLAWEPPYAAGAAQKKKKKKKEKEKRSHIKANKLTKSCMTFMGQLEI